jgi:Holliday junction DNA helicase RuvA
MIGKLTGQVDSVGEDWALIDVAGVGYHVFCSRRSLERLPPGSGPVAVLVETHVREDHIHLYGFIDQAERDWFRLLCTVQGVGARMALAILSVLLPQDLIQAIAAQDKAQLTRAGGVGPKLASRILVELKDKAGNLVLGPAAAAVPPNGAGGGLGGGLGRAAEDAVSALINLGYGRSESFGAVVQASRALGDGAPLGALITAGLKELST